MKKSLSAIGVILLQLMTTGLSRAEDPKQTVIRISEDSDIPNAVVISMNGKCEYSEDGVKFHELTSKHAFIQNVAVQSGTSSSESTPTFTLNQGAVVRTGADSRVDIFFRRAGTTVRLQPETEVKFEKMSRSTRNGVPVVDTLLDLRKGRIFTVVRSLVVGSTFEIRNEAGRSVVEGAEEGSMGRYIITADGTQVTDKSSALPLKLFSKTGITVITPGQRFDAKEGKTLPVETPDAVKTLIEFDELHAMIEAANPVAPKKLPSK